MAAAIGRALGRTVRLARVPFPLFLRTARLKRLPIAPLAVLRHCAADEVEGAFMRGAPTYHAREATDRAPEAFESVARRHAAGLRRGLGPTPKQLARFPAVPAIPAPPVGSHTSGLRMPVPVRPVSATRSPVLACGARSRVPGGALVR